MSDTTQATQPAQPLVVNIQYVKDLSFEVPGAPQIFTTLRAQPQVAINLDVQARRVQDGQPVFEVSLVIKAEASDPNAPTNGGTQTPPVFVAELTYAGVFTLNGLPDNAVEPVLLALKLPKKPFLLSVKPKPLLKQERLFVTLLRPFLRILKRCGLTTLKSSKAMRLALLQ